MHFIRKSLTIYCMLFVLLSHCSIAYASSFCSITDIATESNEGWHQTYEAHGRTITIDVDFTVPQTAEIPIIIVRWANYDITPATLSEDLIELTENAFAFSSNSPIDAPRGKGNTSDLTYITEPWDFSKVYIENSDLTLGEAISIAKEKIGVFSNGAIQLEPEYLSATAIRKSVDGYPEGPAIGKGYYDLEFRQLIRGIPILGGIQMTMDGGVSGGSGYPSPNSYISSTNEYAIGTTYMVEVEEVYADVPLYPFSLMKEKFEELIMSGNLRSIDSIRLGYVLYLDSNDKERVVAFPAWVVRTDHYFAGAKDEIPNEIQGRPRESYRHTQDPLVFNAQTGEMVEFHTKNLDVINSPHIIIWDEVGGKP